MKNIYCPRCNKLVNTEVNTGKKKLQVKKTMVEAEQVTAYCPFCNDSIADEEMSRTNLNSALEAYRVATGLLSPKEIKQTYSQYGLTQGSFAKLLGLGGATLSRYEHGALQTKQIDKAIRQAGMPENMLNLLKSHGNKISVEQKNIAEQNALTMLSDNTPL